MKNVKTFNQFVNENNSVNESKSDKDIMNFLRPFAEESVKSLGFGYKGSRPMYGIQISKWDAYDVSDLPKDVFSLVPTANGNFWSKRHLKKVAPIFAQDLNGSQNKYKVEFLEYDSRGNQVLIKVTK